MAFYTLGLTFESVITLTVIVLAVWIYGIYFNFKKWGLGSTGYHDRLRNSFWLFIATWIHEAFKEGVWIFLRTLVLDVLILRRTLARSPVRWVMHLSIFYGFIVLATFSVLGLMLDIINHFNIVGLAEQAELVKDYLSLPFDLFGYLLLFGATIALLRRILIKFVRDNTTAYDAFLIGAVWLITITGFYAEWMRGNSFLVGNMFAYPIYAPHFALIHTILALFLFALVFPWTKYIHIIATPMTLLANRGGE
jgi:heterodisulfide reductase subunit E